MKRKILKIIVSLFVIILIAINTSVQINNNKNEDIKLGYLKANADSHDEAQRVLCWILPIVYGCSDHISDECSENNYCK